MGQIVWRASKASPVRITACLGDNGTGFINLWRGKTMLASNPSSGECLEYDLPAQPPRARLTLDIQSNSLDGSGKPVFLTVSQGGAILAADDGIGTSLNGPPPNTSLKLDPDAPSNSPITYSFAVAFK